MTGMSKSEIYRQIKAERFPPSERRSHRVAIWWETDIRAYNAGNWRTTQ